MADRDARERIRHGLEESLLVEAAAGTGKTTELIHRLVAALKTGRARIHQVVAVTFTRKAAGELKLRLRVELDRVRSQTQQPEQIENLESAMARLEEAHIGTIHSFCADLLRERPVEAGIDPDFRELSEDEAPALFNRAFRAWVPEKLNQETSGLQRALSRERDGFGLLSPLERVRSAGWQLVEWRDFPKAWRRQPFDRETQVDRLLEDVFGLAALSREGRPGDTLRTALRPARSFELWVRRYEVEKRRDYDFLESLLVRLLRDLNQGARRKGYGRYGKRVSRQDVLDRRDELLAALDGFRRQADADLAAQLQKEMKGLVQRYEELKHQTGRLDFVDLLIRTRDLLRDNDGVRQHLQNTFTHILVDEFQDSDPLQVEILLLLAADDPGQSDWRLTRPMAGKLFLVGDPKQSIYGFRRADVLLYQEVKNRLARAGVRSLALTRSFRSVRSLQVTVNAAFREQMQHDAKTGQAEYQDLEEHAGTPQDQPSLVALPVPRPYGVYGVTMKAINESYPDALGAFVEWLIHSSGWKVRDPDDPQRRVALAPRHICVLFRRFLAWRTDVTRSYARTLEARGIPHVLVGARSFHQREEVETLRVALSAIEWPDDELAVFAALKGSLFAIEDSLLLAFRSQVGSLHPFRPLPEDLEAVHQPVQEALQFLADLHRRRNRRPTVETLHQLLTYTRAHAGFALRPAGHQILANVQRVCDLARNFEVTGGLSFRAFVEHLNERAERPNSNEAPVLEEGVEGVRMMTVHAAKGLEFPVVILADMTAKLAQAQPSKFVDPETGLAATRILGCSPWELLDNEDLEHQRDEAEGVRIAYVAATRARDLLVVPVLGEGPLRLPGWLTPLNAAVYPAPDDRKRPGIAPGCPIFGEATTLSQPSNSDLVRNFVKPGLHRPESGQHQVVWWDPALLRLDVQAQFGVREEQILSPHPNEDRSAEGLGQYQKWQAARDRATEQGEHARTQVLTVTETQQSPSDFEATIRVETLPRPPERPGGSRFGTLVHTILRDVPLAGSSQDVDRLAGIHARVLGALDREREAAVRAVTGVLQHPLVRRAHQADPCHREVPVMVALEGNRVLEGTIDLAFAEEGRWTVIDFKTDEDLAAHQGLYEKQLLWYLFALQRTAGVTGEGWLLGI